MALPPRPVLERIIETAETDSTPALAGKLHTLTDLSDHSYEQIATAIEQFTDD